MMKYKLYTHTDLDGIGCAIVAFQILGKDNVDVEYCDYHTVDDKISKLLNDEETLKQYDRIYITDISVNEEVAQTIDTINDYYHGYRFVLLDHHEKAEWLNKYDWARVLMVDENDGSNTCGTSLFAGYLEEQGYMIEDCLNRFIEIARRYDTWDWTRINDPEPKKWNDLFYLYGRDRFIKKVHFELLALSHTFLNEQDLLFLEVEQEKINRYIAKSLKTLTIKNVGKYNVGMVFSENYINEVAHQIHDEYPHLDLVAVINMRSRKISYRTNREDVDVNQFAQYFGGGGRPQTAGSQMHTEKYNFILDVIFSV